MRRLGVALVVLCASSTARADEPPPRFAIRVDYIRGPNTRCPDEHVARDMLHAEVLYDEDPNAELHLVVEAARRGQDHRLFSVMRDRAGPLWSREHQSRDCADALESTMVSTGLELAGLQRRREQERASRERAAQEAREREAREREARERAVQPTAAAAAVVSPPPSLPPPSPPFALFSGADLVAGIGSTPSPSLGPGVFVALRPANLALSVELAGRASWSLGAAEVGYEQKGYVTVRSTFYAGQLSVCGHVRFAFFCPVVGIGKLAHRRSSSATKADASPPFAVLGVRVGAAHRWGDVLVRGFVELDSLPGAPSLALYGREQWQPSVAGVLGLGFAFQP